MNICARFLVLVTLLVPVFGARAAEPLDQGLRFSLAVARDTTDLRYENDAVVETRQTRVSLEIWQRDLRWLQLGLTGGVDWLSQDGDPVTEGRSFAGNHIGLLARSEVPLSDRLGLIAAGHWIYHDLSDDGDEGEERVDLEWYDTYGRAGAYVTFGPLTLEGGATAGLINGERRRPGETRDIEAEHTTGAYVRLGLATDRTGEVSALFETGTREAVQIHFTRRF